MGPSREDGLSALDEPSLEICYCEDGGVRDSEGKEATRKGVRVNAREAEQVARELFKLVVFQGGDAKVSL